MSKGFEVFMITNISNPSSFFEQYKPLAPSPTHPVAPSLSPSPLVLLPLWVESEQIPKRHLYPIRL